jgi:ABC-2 type transport system permease protein
MLNLFKIEWLKIKTYRTFWLLFLSYIVLSPLFIGFVAYKYITTKATNIAESAVQAMIDNPFIFPRIWHSTTYFSGLFFVVIAMLFILLITNEVQYRTHRQNIIDGWSRLDFLKAKFTLLIAFVLVSTLMTFVTGLAIGLYFSPNTQHVFDGIKYVGYFALMATVYLMVAFLVAILVKRTGLSIIIYFVLVVIVDNLLYMGLTFKQSQLGFFLPLETVDSLIPLPFKPKMVETRTVSDNSLIACAFVYLSLYVFIIIRYFKKADLKN